MKQLTFLWIVVCSCFFLTQKSNAQCTSTNYDQETCSDYFQIAPSVYGQSNSILNFRANLAPGDFYYINSVTGNPWGNTTNQVVMDSAFGAGNWTQEFFETLNPAVVFAAPTRFVFIDGGDENAIALNDFLVANLPAIEAWVNTGGTLLLNSAPNEGGNINFGFGGTTLVYEDMSSTVSVVDTSHPAYLGPNTPTATTMSGGSYSHASITGSGYSSLLVDSGNPAKVILAEKAWGSGRIMVGGMTTVNFHYPQQEAANWRINLLVYMESLAISGPVITCPGDSAFSNDPGVCGALVNYTVTATDNEDGTLTPTQTAGLPSGSEFPVGVTTNTFEVTDSDGNTVSCSFDVTVNDTEAPEITCPSDITQGNDMGTCGAVVTFADPTVTDNCSSGTFLNTMSNQNSAFSGNSRGYWFTAPEDFIITSLRVPTLASNADQSIMVMSFAAPPAVYSGTSSYDALLFYTQLNPDSGFIPANIPITAGQIIGILGVRGNTNSYTSDATINIGGNPLTITRFGTQNDISTGPAPQGSFWSEPLTNLKSNVDFEYILGSSILSAIQTAGLPSGSEFPLGTTTNTFEVTDASGNTSSCSFEVTVNDTEAPVAVCQNITVELDGSGNLTILPTDINNGSTDNCGVDTIEFTQTFTAFAEANEGGNLTITLPVGQVVTSVDFASYGTPNGSNGNYTIGACHAVNSQAIVEGYALGNNTFTIPATNDVFGDPCGGFVKSLYVTVSSSTVSNSMDFTCANLGANNVTLLVTDVNGNTSTCTATVTVEDNEDPIITCAPNATRDTDAGLCEYTIVGTEFDATFTDNCTSGTITNDLNGTDTLAGEILPKGNTTIIWTVDDGNGQTATCTTVITVEDNEDPIITCAPNATRDTDAGVCEYTAVGTEFDATFTDNCSDGSITNDFNGTATLAGEIFPTGDTTVVWTVNDGNGQTTTCTTVITIEDNEAPIIACPADINVNTDIGHCYATVSFSTAIAFDNCGVDTIIQTAGLPSGSQFPVGVNTIEFTATDINGNTSTCSFAITVTDNEAPIAVCQNITIQLDANGTVIITASDVDGGSTDQCGVASTTIDVDTFDCSNVGDNNVILTVTDINGNTSTCTAIVTVEDVTAPVVACQNITLELDPTTGTVTIAGTDIDNGSTDACGIASYDLDIDTFDCSNIGENTVVLTVTDVNGNTASCTAIVTIEDNTSPVLVCQDFIIEIGADGTATLNPNDVIASNDDACGIFTVAVDITQFSCADIGTPVTVQVFSQDNNGNLSTCTATVTAVDLLAPVITCPADQTIDPGTGNLFYILPDYFATGEATAIDNCTSPVTVTTQNPAVGTPLSDGVHTITLTATDEYGNIGTCEFELTVESVLGTNNNSHNLESIAMYPNPAKSEVIIGNPQSLQLESADIYDLAGRLVKSFNLKGMATAKTLNVDNLEAAIYVVIIKGKEGQINKRLLKE